MGGAGGRSGGRAGCRGLAATVTLDDHRFQVAHGETARSALEPARFWLRADAALGIASVAEIDSMNILQATLLAMRRAVARLAHVPDLVLVDGNRAPQPALPGEDGGGRRP